MSEKIETATFAGGCFWCTEAVFMRLRGVRKVISGYAGGEPERATYAEVCSGTTGHAEAVQISFDREVISFADLLEVFWRVHDPTTRDRQGADVGTQYRSVIFFHSEEQRRIAVESKETVERSGLWEHPVVTEIEPFTTFFPAEEYHQRYYETNPLQPYCRIVIDPKLRKLRETFAHLLQNGGG